MIILTKLILLVISILLFLPHMSYSQIGVGLGTKGINFKSSPHKKWRCFLRNNLVFTRSNEAVNITLSPEIAGIKHIINNNTSFLYSGIGIKSNLYFLSSFNPKAVAQENIYGFKIPLGIELLISEKKNISISIENGLDILYGNSTYTINFSGLVEITYYFTIKKNTNKNE